MMQRFASGILQMAPRWLLYLIQGGLTPWHPDGKYLAAGLTDNTVRVWDTSTWNVWNECELADSVEAVEYARWDGSIVVASSRDGSVFIWEPKHEHEPAVPLMVGKSKAGCVPAISKTGWFCSDDQCVYRTRRNHKGWARERIACVPRSWKPLIQDGYKLNAVYEGKKVESTWLLLGSERRYVVLSWK